MSACGAGYDARLRRRRPYYDHISAQRFADFAHKKVGVGASHPDADDADWRALVAASNREETTLGSQSEGFRRGIEKCRDAFSSGR